MRKQMIKIESSSGGVCLLTAGVRHIINLFIQDSMETVFRILARTTTNCQNRLLMAQKILVLWLRLQLRVYL